MSSQRMLVVRLAIGIAAKELNLGTIELVTKGSNHKFEDVYRVAYDDASNTMFIDPKWLNKDDMESVLRAVFFEMRRYYQWVQIRKYQQHEKTDEDVDMVQKWSAEASAGEPLATRSQKRDERIEDALKFSTYFFRVWMNNFGDIGIGNEHNSDIILIKTLMSNSRRNR